MKDSVTPEHALMLAMLKDAVDLIVRGKNPDAVLEAREWIAVESAWLFSFDAVWSSLFPDFDVEAARNTVQTYLVLGIRLRPVIG